jgi:5-carboxymethyl-2-hydroxymuconate isomerase
MKLNTDPNIADADTFYQKLVELHAGRSEDQSRLINASLVLLLANHIGDMDVLDEAMRIAASTA